MQNTRVTRSTVLGKRGHSQQDSTPSKATGQLQTPDPTPNPKRPRTSISLVIDGDGNKENIPPYRVEAINADSSPVSARAVRALRRTATEIVSPTATRPPVRRRASTSTLPPSTPTHGIAAMTIATPPPTPPTLLLPLHTRVKALLRATCNNAELSIAGRDTERVTITGFLDPFINGASTEQDAPTSLFISGSPGTGKTALVNSIIQSLGHDGTTLTVMSVNCMTLKCLDALWDRIIEELRCQQDRVGRSKKEKGKVGVSNLLKSHGGRLLLILDELDHIASDWQSLSALFSLTEATSASLRIVGIANTHTLTANSSAANLVSTSAVQTLHFAPYTPIQLQDILRARLASIYDECESAELNSNNNIKKLLPTPAITLLTKRIANLTGDVRSLFEVLRGAIDLAVSVTSSPDGNPLDVPSPSVTPQHIIASLKAYAPSSPPAKSSATSSAVTSNTGNSEIVSKIVNLGFQSRIVLLTILMASKRFEAGLAITSSNLSASPRKSAPSPIKRASSAPVPSMSASTVGLDTQQLYAFYNTVLERSDLGAFDPVSRNDFGDLLGVLEGVGLVQMSSSLLASSSARASKPKRGFSRSASFGAGLGRNGAGTVGKVKLVEGVWTDEVLRGLGISDSSSNDSDLRNEEVKALWLAESSRLARDVKTLAANTSKKDRVSSFEDAFEA